MLDVVFCDSEKGVFKIARKNRSRSREAFSLGVIGQPDAKTIQRCQQKLLNGKPLGADAADVIGLPFSLDIGDISSDVIGPERKAVLLKQFGAIGKDQREAYWQACKEDFQRLKERAGRGEKIRIWYSNSPYSVCGFYFVQFVLKDFSCEVSAIKLPELIQQEETVLRQCSTWGEIEPEELYFFLPLEQEVSKAERRMLAQKWLALREENASLRAVVNGQLISVAEDFYDVLIRRCIPEGNFPAASLVGNILLRYPLGVSDWWYLQRIQNMIETGELEIVEEHPEAYRRVLKRNDAKQ